MKLKISGILSVGFALLIIFGSTGACKAGGDKAGEDKGGGIKVGTPCKEVGPSTGKFACVDNNLLFCSSFTSYKFKLQTECKADQVCKIAASGKSASCAPK